VCFGQNPVEEDIAQHDSQKPSVVRLLRPATFEYPNYQQRIHDVGAIGMTVSNWGSFGDIDWYGGEALPSGEYPIHSDIRYMHYGGIWIGGVVGDDTLVSTVSHTSFSSHPEFSPDRGEPGAFRYQTSIKGKEGYSPEAVSEQDFICTYTDTITAVEITGEDEYDNRGHCPLGISVSQRTSAWSYDYANEFIFFDYAITNIDTNAIHDMFFGIQADGLVRHISNSLYGGEDDVRGFRRVRELAPVSCRTEDTLNMAWWADNDGDPTPGWEWNFASPRGISGIHFLRPEPSDSIYFNYNWWVGRLDPSQSFGPRQTNNFRPFPRDLCCPTGDIIKYYVLSHPEVDYDQMLTGISHVGEGFLPPPRQLWAYNLADGFLGSSLLSCGPFTLEPGDTVPITLAYIAGDNFHVNPGDFANYFHPWEPYSYIERLSFKELDENAIWAEKVYDNPGWDTDGDGNAGRYIWQCNCDGVSFCFEEDWELDDSLIGCCRKVYFKGDGVPDFRPASPPPPPAVRLTPSFGQVTIRWNGKESEEYIDFLTGEGGFEGYRVYMAEDDRLTDFVLLTSYDIDDYRVYQYNTATHVWDGISLGVTRDSLQQLYGPDFEPSDYYDEFHYFTDPSTGSILRFAQQDWNQSDLTDPLRIHKKYPMSTPDDPSYLRYYEYEFTIDNLQPSKPYHFAVTTFNKGSFDQTMHVLESSPLINAVREFPLPPADVVEEQGMGVIVYPNPYRITDRYARVGYENRDRTKSAPWARRIHFANLPKICTIRIYTISGDLVRARDQALSPRRRPGIPT
jgi:hypothetical protein